MKLPKLNDPIPVPRMPFSKLRVLFVWFMVFLAMSIYAIAWFSCGLMVMPFIEAITSQYRFDPPWDSVVNTVKLFFLYHPIIAMVGWILWGFLNSLKRDIDRWRAY